MKSAKRILALAVSAVLMLGTFAGCGTKNPAAPGSEAASGGESTQSTARDPGTIKQFNAFFAVPGTEINDGNEIQEKIAEITGARVKETWLTGQSATEAVGMLIAGGEYPDFIDGSDGMKQLLQAGALVELDDYIDKYPNIKNYYTKFQWAQLRQGEGGHIYFLPQFGVTHLKSTDTIHNDEAFWIQTRVLKWANYPKVETLDQYFDLIERYLKANPTMENGTKNIGYTILCDDWRYFCLENAPEFLDGYPNDGSVIVDPNTQKVIDYNMTPTAKQYFQKLNEEYKKGIVDPESFTQKYDQYISKLSTGRVLGMIDQYWDFSSNVNSALWTQKLDQQGCDYVPLPITIKEGVKNQWHTIADGGWLNIGSGLGISISCKDVEGALQFVNDILSPEVVTLRNWGIKDQDYNVGSDGLFTRTQEMRDNASDTNYMASHLCSYSYFPNFGGMNLDDKNAATPDHQPQEFYDGLKQDIKDCFTAYNTKTYCGMIGINTAPGPWYPIYTYSNTLTTSTPEGTAWTKMGEVKHKWLPRVCMAKDFETEWNNYVAAYNEVKPQDFIGAMQKELDSRIAFAKENS